MGKINAVRLYPKLAADILDAAQAARDYLQESRVRACKFYQFADFHLSLPAAGYGRFAAYIGIDTTVLGINDSDMLDSAATSVRVCEKR
jgi:hypothetical protein